MSVISGIMQSSATESAADTAAQSATDASALQYKMFQEQQTAMEPWRASGANALDRLNALMGLPQYQDPNTLKSQPKMSDYGAPGTAGFWEEKPVPGGQNDESGNPQMERAWNPGTPGVTDQAAYDAAMEKWKTESAPAPPQDWRSLMDPGYEFRKQEGVNALAAAGAASGNYGSGNMGVALQDFGQNLASQEFQNVYNRLAGMSGTGQVQSQAIGNMGVNTGNVMANYLNQAGQNIAQGQIAGANAMAGGVRDLEKGIASYYMYKKPAADYISQSEFNSLWV